MWVTVAMKFFFFFFFWCGRGDGHVVLAIMVIVFFVGMYVLERVVVVDLLCNKDGGKLAAHDEGDGSVFDGYNGDAVYGIRLLLLLQ